MAEMKKEKLLGNFKAVKESFDTPDTRYQQNKVMQVYNIDACRHLDNNLYRQALENYGKLYPDATNGYLLMLDMYYLNRAGFT